ncbi:hypothetical protein QWY31_09840 [Cytophagales bacterium LB-30]|uniref:Uncharacterized protein n=1 Tax=Shiella aurantiaca TaxID=3058365 RepID=A0ABT8F5T0_9BACT|nr:hypothetical protein [Shiella aurantiaca]MDN4165805.1 hypothetical protein [Shiella aurantiaca]
MKKLGIALLLAASLSACEKETMGVDAQELVPATLTDLSGLDGCGWVFELNDGTQLEFSTLMRCWTPPVSAEDTRSPFDDFVFEEGKKVWIRYEELPEAVSICMVGPVVEIKEIKTLE